MANQGKEWDDCHHKQNTVVHDRNFYLVRLYMAINLLEYIEVSIKLINFRYINI